MRWGKRPGLFACGLGLAGTLTGCNTFDSIIERADRNRAWFREQVCSDSMAWVKLRELVRGEFAEVGIDMSGYCPAVMSKSDG